MLKAYPGGGGFGWQMNEIIGAQIVQVPMSTPIHMADDAFRTLMITLVGVFVFILIVLNILLQVVVIGPVKKMSALAERVSHGETNVEELHLKGKDEVAVLGESFNRMRISLAKALNMLEGE